MSIKIHQSDLVELLSTAQSSSKPSFRDIQGHYEHEQLHDLQLIKGNLSCREPLLIQSQSEGTTIQLHLVLSGSSRIGTEKKGLLFQKQEQHLLQHADVDSTLYVVGDPAYRFVEINLGQAFLERILAYGDHSLETLFLAKQQGMVVSLSKQSVAGHPAISAIIQELVRNPFLGTLRALYLESKVMELLIWQAAGLPKPITDVRVSLKDRDKLYHARELIRQHIKTPYTVAQLAKLVGMSESSLKRGFKTAFGNTIFGYLYELRMDQARILLHDNRYSVAEVAYQIGYQHSQHFSAAFKRRFGYLPSQHMFL